MGSGYSLQTTKTKLKMAVQRLNLHQNKKCNLLNVSKRQIAELLENGKSDSAKIRVEGIIRDEKLILCMELLALHCELILQRIGLINVQKFPPTDLIEPMCSIMYCSNRLEIQELREISSQFRHKYGSDWFKEHNENRSKNVTMKIVSALNVSPPGINIVIGRLKAIAEEFGVDWEYVPTAEEISFSEEKDNMMEGKISEDIFEPIQPIQPIIRTPQPEADMVSPHESTPSLISQHGISPNAPEANGVNAVPVNSNIAYPPPGYENNGRTNGNENFVDPTKPQKSDE